MNEFLQTEYNVKELTDIAEINFGYPINHNERLKPNHIELLDYNGGVIRRYRNPSESEVELAYLVDLLLDEWKRHNNISSGNSRRRLKHLDDSITSLQDIYDHPKITVREFIIEYSQVRRYESIEDYFIELTTALKQEGCLGIQLKEPVDISHIDMVDDEGNSLNWVTKTHVNWKHIDNKLQ